jgi:hypothetical protein
VKGKDGVTAGRRPRPENLDEAYACGIIAADRRQIRSDRQEIAGLEHEIDRLRAENQNRTAKSA